MVSIDSRHLSNAVLSETRREAVSLHIAGLNSRMVMTAKRAFVAGGWDAVAGRGCVAVLSAWPSERQGRVIDRDPAGSMEKKKQKGYF